MLRFGCLIRLALRPTLPAKKNIPEIRQFLRYYCSTKIIENENETETKFPEFNSDEISSEQSQNTRSNKFSMLDDEPSRQKIVSASQFEKFTTKILSYRELMKILVMNEKIDEQNVKILCDGLSYLNIFSSDFSQYFEFVDFYPFWWKLFKENLANFDGESLVTIIDVLGLSNLKTNGLLRRFMTVEDISLIISHLYKDFPNLAPNSISLLFGGLTNLSLKHEVSASTSSTPDEKECLLNEKLVRETIEWIKKHESSDEKFYDVAFACCFLAERLSLIGFKNENHLEDELMTTIVDVTKTMFDLNSKLSKELADSVDLSKMINGQLKFARAFLKLKNNNFTFVKSDEIWSVWLNGATNLLEIIAQTKALSKAIHYHTTYPFNDRKMPTLIFGLCSLTLKVASTFNKMNDFDEFKSTWSRLLNSCLKPSARRSLNELVNVLRDVETNVDVKNILDKKSSDVEMNSDDLWAMISKEFDRQTDKMTKTYITKDTPRKDFNEKDLGRLRNRFGPRLTERTAPSVDADEVGEDEDSFASSKKIFGDKSSKFGRKSFVSPEIEMNLKRSKPERSSFKQTERSLSDDDDDLASHRERSSPPRRRSIKAKPDEDFGEDDFDDETPTDRHERNRNLGGRRFGADKFEAFPKHDHSAGHKRFVRDKSDDFSSRGRQNRQFDNNDDEDFDDEDFGERRRPAMARRLSARRFDESAPRGKKFNRNASRREEGFGGDDDDDGDFDDRPSFRQRRRSDDDGFNLNEKRFNKGGESGLIKRRFKFNDSDDSRRSFRSKSGSSRKFSGQDDDY